MDAIETLMSEHQTILSAIEALTAFAGEVQRGGGDGGELGRFVRFIREYADTLHHGKEEDVLFAAMVEAGFPRGAGPIGVMLNEHALGRQYVAALAALSVQPSWDGAARQRIVEAAHGYGALLRAHIHKEDAILYPMAEQRLPPELASRVDADCAALDAQAEASGRRAALERLAAELVAIHAPGLSEAAGA